MADKGKSCLAIAKGDWLRFTETIPASSQLTINWWKRPPDWLWTRSPEPPALCGCLTERH
jgi:hypothetical protein